MIIKSGMKQFIYEKVIILFKYNFSDKKSHYVGLFTLILAYIFVLVLIFSAVVFNVFNSDFYFVPFFFVLTFVGWISVMYVYIQRKSFGRHYEIIMLLLLVWFVVIVAQRIKFLIF